MGRVLHLVEHLYQGGIERLLEQLARNTPAEQHQLFFYTYHTKQLTGIGQELASLHTPVFCYDKGKGYDFRLLKDLIRVVRAERITVVHTHDFGPMEYAVALKLRFPKLILIHTHHTIHDFIRYKRYMLFFQFAALFYRRILGVSQYVTDVLSRKCPLARPKLHTIYNGLDLAAFASIPRTVSKPKRLRLVNVSRISAEKNLRHLFQACARLKREQIPFELHHAGSGDASLEAELREFLYAEDLTAEVHLHGFQKDVRPILALGDVFVSPSTTEGHPVAVLEAMAAGLLCLCSDIPAHRLLSERGILFFSLEGEALFESLKSVFMCPEAYNEHVRRARNEVEARFSLVRMIGEYGRTYA